MNPNGFHAPDTLVGERIEQLELDPPRPKEKQWLKQTLATRWPEDLPQPFMGFDEDEGAYTLVWQSDSRCNTLNVHADRKTGTYCPWPSNHTEEYLEDLDLNTDEAWLFLKNGITWPARH